MGFHTVEEHHDVMIVMKDEIRFTPTQHVLGKGWNSGRVIEGL